MRWLTSACSVGSICALFGCSPAPQADRSHSIPGAPETSPSPSPVTLKVACWDDYVTPEVAADYERETGVHVEVEFVNSNELVIERLQNGEVWDVVTPSDYAVQQMQEGGLLVRLRHENLRNLGNVARRFQNASYDRELAYAVPLFWGTTGWGYDKRVYSQPPSSWAYVFDPEKRKLANGRLSLINDMRETMGIALLHLGYSLNTTNPNEISAARDLLRSAKSGIRGFDSEHFDDAFADGGNALVHGWSGDLAQAIAENEHLAFTLPKEGFLLFIDNLAIPAVSPHREEAERFIDYLLRPEVAARLSNSNFNPSCNGPARALIRPEVAAGPSFDLPDDARFEVLRHLGAKTALYEAAWAEVVAP